MKALTLWQPWASTVALGEKAIETRCWTTKYRGELAIHSAAKLPPQWLGASRHNDEFRNELADILNCRRDHVESSVKALPFGSVLCIVRLVGIQETPDVRDTISERERIFGNYEDGRYAWFLEMVRKFDEPIPAKGNRLLWNWNEDAGK
jgi:hypothetical protein